MKRAPPNPSASPTFSIRNLKHYSQMSLMFYQLLIPTCRHSCLRLSNSRWMTYTANMKLDDAELELARRFFAAVERWTYD